MIFELFSVFIELLTNFEYRFRRGAHSWRSFAECVRRVLGEGGVEGALPHMGSFGDAGGDIELTS